MGKKKEQFESYDRLGRLFRDIPMRGEGWPTIEYWARTNDYTLIEFHNRHRVYRHGDFPILYVTYFDFKMNEGDSRVKASCWIEVGILLRLLTLFLMPEMLEVIPNGIWGVKVRRAACHAMNSLLARMNQNKLAGSSGLHWADLDLTTIILGAGSIFTLIQFVIASHSFITIAHGLSNNLMHIVARYSLVISGIALLALLIQQLVVARLWNDTPIPYVSAGVFYVVILATTIFLFTRSRTETRDLKISYFCIQRYQPRPCHALITSLSAKERQSVAQSIFQLQNLLTRREKLLPFRGR